MATLGAAKNVSPLIRFGRWAGLLTGFVYGSWRLSYLTKKEKGIQLEENAIRAKRDARLSAQKLAVDNVQMNDLGRECGIVKS